MPLCPFGVPPTLMTHRTGYSSVLLPLNSPLNFLQVAALRQELAEVKSSGDHQLNTTLKKEKIAITRTTPCTLDDITSMIRKKTFLILDRNIRNAISPPPNIMTTTQVTTIRCNNNNFVKSLDAEEAGAPLACSFRKKRINGKQRSLC